MKIKRTLFAVTTIAVLLVLSLGAVATAAVTPIPSVWGGVEFVQGEVESFATFGAWAVGPAALGEEHQPARGFLAYSDDTGLRYLVSVQHIHTHSANEVHFGGVIVKSNDSSLVGMHAHAVAIDSGKRGGKGDMISVLVTAEDSHDHAEPVPVDGGNLVVRTQ